MCRVYLVEDSPLLAQLITGLLDGEPDVNVVGHADTAREATAGILDLKPDAVVLDLHLREGTGIDVLRSLAQAGAAPTCIVLSNHATPPYRKASLDAGARHFFDKGTEIPQMLALIRKLAGSAPLTA